MRHPCSDKRVAQFMFASPRSAKHVPTSSCVKALARMSYTRSLVSFFIFQSCGSLLRGHGAHVEKPPSMAVRIDKAVRVHEAEILRLVVGRPSRGNRFGDKIIHLFTALAAEVEQNLHRLARIAD